MLSGEHPLNRRGVRTRGDGQHQEDPRLDGGQILRGDPIAGVGTLGRPPCVGVSMVRPVRSRPRAGHDEHFLVDRVLDAVALRAARGAGARRRDDDALAP